MKNTPAFFLIACLLAISSFSFGQTTKCIIPVPEFVSLIGANQAKADQVLGKCFKSLGIEDLDGKTKTRKYRMDYKVSKKSDWVDYDVFHVYVTEKTVAFSTTNYDVYVAYKSALKDFGFDKETENRKSTIYKYEKYKMETSTAKNATHKLTYNIFISL